MTTLSRRNFLVTSALATPLAAPFSAWAKDSDASIRKIAEEAYIWGVPLVVQESYLQLARTGGHPINRFTLSTGLSTPDDKVAGPNVDTLYGFAWLDLQQEPLVLHVPNTQDRYYSIQLIDAYANSFAYVGRRATGTKEGRYAVTGPDWKGALPEGVTKIESPTNRVLALTRTLVRGQADLPAAQAIQLQYTLTPLSKLSELTLDPLTVASAINVFPILALGSSGAKFFDDLGAGLASDPPPARENAPLERFAKAGIGPNRRPTASGDDQLASTLSQAAVAADARVKAASFVTNVNGWKVSYRISSFITDPLLRASVNRLGPGAHIAEEALYFSARTDAVGKPLSGAASYRVHFPAGQLPPVDAFWSLILYGPDFFLVRNPINRYSISDRTEGLSRNADGSLDIYIQHKASDQQGANWLPAPDSGFQLILRTYQPRSEVLDKTWKAPPVERIA
jgi:hypothetical protein